ncbi:MAG: four helix bundle protein [Chloroflexia bacterium]
MHFKFERLEVWQLSLDYFDLIYVIAGQLPRSEEYNLKSQIARAATSITLNIAEGSTSQTDAEQARFIGLALRSLIETIACQHLISRRKLLDDLTPLRQAYLQAQTLFAKLQSMRKALVPEQKWLKEGTTEYETEEAYEENGIAPW